MSRAYRVTTHARQEMERRNITEALLEQIIAEPGQIVDAFGDRKAYQSQIEVEGRLYLVRVIVEESDVLTILMVYRTSKIAKYWSESHESNV